MNIAVAFAESQVAPLNDSKEILIFHIEGQEITGRELMSVPAGGMTALMPLLAQHECEVLICGELSVVARNVLEMIGIILVPGVTGDAEPAVRKYLAGEKQGDTTILEVCREEDPDDPMQCLHDCSKCAGCGPVRLTPEEEARLPKI